jgi:Holliday junction resolvase-like predicted endonuclease
MSTADLPEKLRATYAAMLRLDGISPQERGRQFNRWIADLLRAHGIDAQENHRSLGEIDVVFSIGDTRYILEAKWQQTKADTGQLAKLQKRLRQRLSGTYGVFVSMAGYTPDALTDLVQGDRLELILLDREHIEAVLTGEISPQVLLSKLRDAASFAGQPYTPMAAVRDASRGVATTQLDTTTAGHIRLPVPSQVHSTEPVWDPQQAHRGNPSGQYATFHGYQNLYWANVAVMFLLVFVTSFGVIDGRGLWKVLFGGAIAVEVLLIVQCWRLAMRPIRLEIGTAGIQTFFPRNTAWIPWEYIDRVDIIRADGNLAVVAWSKHANLFPTAGESGLGAFYLPAIGAVAVCPLGPLRAKRHDVARALHMYGMNRY